MGEIRLSHSTTVQDHQRIDSCIHTVDYRTPVWKTLLLAKPRHRVGRFERRSSDTRRRARRDARARRRLYMSAKFAFKQEHAFGASTIDRA